MTYSSEIHGVPSMREQEYLAGWQRARAELQNARTRFVQQQQDDAARQRAGAFEPLLALADHFRSLAAHMPEGLQGDGWAQGVLHIAREFDRILAEQGIEHINPANEPFDPSIHEAVAYGEGSEKNVVIEVVQVGYKFGERVLRPARVKVAK